MNDKILSAQNDLEEAIRLIINDRNKLLRKNKQLGDIISQIEQRAFDWDGKESQYYGNTIMKIIHPGWMTKEGVGKQ